MFPKGSAAMVSATASLLVWSGPALYWKVSTVCQVWAGAVWVRSAAAANSVRTRAVERGSRGPAWSVNPGRGRGLGVVGYFGAFVFIILFWAKCCFIYQCAKRGAKRIRGVKSFLALVAAGGI